MLLFFYFFLLFFHDGCIFSRIYFPSDSETLNMKHIHLTYQAQSEPYVCRYKTLYFSITCVTFSTLSNNPSQLWFLLLLFFCCIFPGYASLSHTLSFCAVNFKIIKHTCSAGELCQFEGCDLNFGRIQKHDPSMYVWMQDRSGVHKSFI